MNILSKWAIVCLYTIGIFAVTPYLPRLIKLASTQWSSSGVSHFVLGVEIIIAFLIMAFVTGFSIYKKKKSAIFIIAIIGIFLLSFIIYHYIPNPNEFTHLPEYAILSMLIIRAMDKGNGSDLGIGIKIEKKIKFGTIGNPFFFSGLITGTIGTGDEIYQYFLPNRFFS